MDHSVSATMNTLAGDDLIAWRDGAAGRLRLNRPKALNALTHEMCLGIEQALEAWIDDDRIKCVIIEGEGEKAFCAGGDVLPIFNRGREIIPFWHKEYRLNHLIRFYPKPYVALIDGIDMGGGVGVSSHGSHRIVTGNSLIAMPEVSIGFIPDVGGTWLLSRAPGETGRFLGMTASRMKAADAIFAGFADHMTSREAIPQIVEALVSGNNPDEVCGEHARRPEPGVLEENREAIDATFAHDTALACRDALNEIAGTGADWAVKAAQSMDYACPLSVAATHHAVHQARGFTDFAQSLALEYRFAWHMMDDTNFFEGVRALLVDKDKSPKWSPPRLEDVTPEMIAASLAPLSDDEEWTLESARGRKP
jgi:enoyl-CoA hydratase/carnithine racemase